MTIDPQVYSIVVNEESFPDKSVIIKEGSGGDWIHVILEGRVKIKKQTSKGLLTIETLTEGDFIGLMEFLKHSKVPRFTSAIADGPVLVGTLDAELLKKDWESQPQRLKKLISSLMQNLEDAITNFVDLAEASKLG